MQPDTSYQRTGKEFSATKKEIKAKTGSGNHSSPSYLQSRLRGRILVEKVKRDLQYFTRMLELFLSK